MAAILGRFENMKTFASPTADMDGQPLLAVLQEATLEAGRVIDRQAPEGFYNVRPAQMNPNSQYHLAFNIGFPNAYDRAHNRTGQNLMVHGACSSSGCYSMTDDSVSEIYAFGRDAFRGGQRDFQIQAFPFRMTAANMARYKSDRSSSSWRKLPQAAEEPCLA